MLSLAYWYALWQTYWLAWAIFAVYLLVTWFAAGVATRLLRGVINRVASRGGVTLKEEQVTAAARPIHFVVLMAGLGMALGALAGRIPSLGFSAEFGWIQKGVTALIILAVTRLVNGVMKASLYWYMHNLAHQTDGTWDEELLPVIRKVLSAVLYFIALSIILKNFGQDITALVTTAGVASLAVALAAQETLSNMLGGFMILVDRPFRVGDVIELTDGRTGEVVGVGLRSTRIRQFDGNALVVPNKDMANTRIINYAQPDQRAAIRQTIGVDYGTDIPQAKEVLLGVLTAHPEVLPDPAPGVWFTAFGPHSLDLFMSCWVKSYNDRFRITDELNVRILQAFREAGIIIPFPQQDVHLFLQGEEGEVMVPGGSGKAQPDGEK